MHWPLESEKPVLFPVLCFTNHIVLCKLVNSLDFSYKCRHRYINIYVYIESEIHTHTHIYTHYIHGRRLYIENLIIYIILNITLNIN